MIIKCPSCESRFNLPDDKFQEGRKVRCSKCKQVFALTREPEPGASGFQSPAADMAATPPPRPAPPPAQTSAPSSAPAPAPSPKPSHDEDDEDRADEGMASGRSPRGGMADSETFSAAEDDVRRGFSDSLARAADDTSDSLRDAGFASQQGQQGQQGQPGQAGQPAATEVDPFDLDRQPARIPKGTKLTIPRGGAEKKKSPVKLVLAVVLVLLLALGALGALAWFLAPNLLPKALRDMMGDQPAQNATTGQTPVNRDMVKHLEIKDAEQHFVKNKKAGEILVIHGRVLNNSTEMRELIRVEANLLDAAGAKVATRQQLIGNVVSLFQLQELSPDELDKALANPVGITTENTNIKPGDDAPFMVVFVNPPDTVKEFQVIIMDAKVPPKK